jgi:hypothetical protein
MHPLMRGHLHLPAKGGKALGCLTLAAELKTKRQRGPCFAILGPAVSFCTRRSDRRSTRTIVAASPSEPDLWTCWGNFHKGTCLTRLSVRNRYM